MMPKLYIIYILFIILLAIPVSKSGPDDVPTIPDDLVAAYKESLPIDVPTIPDNLVAAYKESLSSGSKSSSTSSSQGNGRGSSSVKNYYTNTATGTFEVNILTDYSRGEDGLLPLRDEVKIIKEFKNLQIKPINGLTICERIEDNVNISLIGKPLCYISYSGNQSSKIINHLLKGEISEAENDSKGRHIDPIIDEDDNKTMSFNVNYFSPKERIIVLYNITAKKEGTVNFGTSVGFNEDNYRDDDHDFKYDIEYPVDVDVNVQNSKKIFTGWFKWPGTSVTTIEYRLNYLSNKRDINVSIEEVPKDYEIKGVTCGDHIFEFNKTHDNDMYRYNRSNNRISFRIPIGKENKINITVDYIHEGEYNVPSLSLDGYSFPKSPVSISVADYINSRSSVLYLVSINLLVLLVTLVFTSRSNRKNAQNSLKVFSDHKKEHLNRLHTSTNSIQWEISQMNLNLNAINEKMDDINGLEYLKDIALELRELNKKIK